MRSLHRVSVRTGAVLSSIILVLALATQAAGSTTSTTPLNTNLVQNPGAEASSATDCYAANSLAQWTTTNGFTLCTYGAAGFVPASEGVRIGGGMRFFAGGVSASSSATQDIALVGRDAAIDTGHLKLTVSAWLASYDGQGDSAQVIVRFLRADKTQIDQVGTARVSATNSVFQSKSASKTVPAGTRYLRVVLSSIRAEGSYNDGYFDNIVVRLNSV